jgi:hypothetical protein
MSSQVLANMTSPEQFVVKPPAGVGGWSELHSFGWSAADRQNLFGEFGRGRRFRSTPMLRPPPLPTMALPPRFRLPAVDKDAQEQRRKQRMRNRIQTLEKELREARGSMDIFQRDAVVH